jgi:putative component of membrane protein insertase Oxa1/YidC/SpoIIIJ protein YidD
VPNIARMISPSLIKKCTFKNVCQDYADDFTLDIRVSVNTVSHDSHVFRSWRVMKC